MTTTASTCPVCNHLHLGDPHTSLSQRLDEARAAGLVGCGHQAMDLLLALLSSAHRQAREAENQSSSVTLYTDGEDFRASFILDSDGEPLIRAGKPADNAAQAIIHLLLDMHDELLLQLASAAVQH